MKTNNSQRRCFMDCTNEQKEAFKNPESRLILNSEGVYVHDHNFRTYKGETYAVEIKEKDEYLTPAYCFGKCLWKSEKVWIMYTDIDQNPKFFHNAGYALKDLPSDRESESLKVGG